MSLLKIVTGKDTEILRTVCAPVEKFDAKLKKLALDMAETMVEAKGLGIAAPQVGVNARVCIVILGYNSKNPVTLQMVNPEIVELSSENALDEEGCLSLPKQFAKVERPKEIVVKFQDLKGVFKQLRLSDLDARVVLHEIDHLNGVLFIDLVEKA